MRSLTLLLLVGLLLAGSAAARRLRQVEEFGMRLRRLVAGFMCLCFELLYSLSAGRSSCYRTYPAVLRRLY